MSMMEAHSTMMEKLHHSASRRSEHYCAIKNQEPNEAKYAPRWEKFLQVLKVGSSHHDS